MSSTVQAGEIPATFAFIINEGEWFHSSREPFKEPDASGSGSL